MKPISFLFAATAVFLSTTVTAAPGDVKVIANASVTADSVSPAELKGIFLLTTTSLAGSGHVEPVLAKGGPAHEEFLKEFVGKSDSGLATYYRGLVFTGKGSMPKTLASDAEVAAYVAKTKGAIGYIGAGTEPAGAKVIEVK